MVNIRIALCACKTWQFWVTHFAIFHDYDHSISVRNTCLSVYSMYSEMHINVFYLKVLSNLCKVYDFALI